MGHAAFVTRTDSTCEANIAREEALANGVSELTEKIERHEKATVKELGEAESDLIAKRSTDLTAIMAAPHQPGGDGEALEAIAGALQSASAATLRWVGALAAHERARAAALSKQAYALEREVEHLSRQFGFKVCGPSTEGRRASRRTRATCSAEGPEKSPSSRIRHCARRPSLQKVPQSGLPPDADPLCSRPRISPPSAEATGTARTLTGRSTA